MNAYVCDLCPSLTALLSCAHVRELVRTKQGQFTLDEHMLKEERWTLQDISAALQACPPSAKQQPGPNGKAKPDNGSKALSQASTTEQAEDGADEANSRD